MSLGQTKSQPLGQEDVHFPFIEQTGVLIAGLNGQYLLPEAHHFNLPGIMVDPQYGIRIGALPCRVGKIVGDMRHGGIGGLFQYIQVQIHLPGAAGSAFAFQCPQVGRQPQQNRVVFLAQIEEIAHRG